MRWIPMLLLLGFTSGAVAAPIPKEVKTGNDAQRILGKWRSEFFSTNGGDQQPLASAWFRFEANGKCGFRDNDDPDSEFSLDTNSSPRRMKWLYGPCKIELSCQYEIDGDTLKVSFINTGTEVPNAIAPAQNATIFYLKRIKE